MVCGVEAGARWLVSAECGVVRQAGQVGRTIGCFSRNVFVRVYQLVARYTDISVLFRSMLKI
jgi:hypothetical protein